MSEHPSLGHGRCKCAVDFKDDAAREEWMQKVSQEFVNIGEAFERLGSVMVEEFSKIEVTIDLTKRPIPKPPAPPPQRFDGG